MKPKKNPLEWIKRNAFCEPIDPKFRSGFKALIHKVVKKHNIVEYHCGGQQFREDLKDFASKYKLAEDKQMAFFR